MSSLVKVLKKLYGIYITKAWYHTIFCFYFLFGEILSVFKSPRTKPASCITFASPLPRIIIITMGRHFAPLVVVAAASFSFAAITSAKPFPPVRGYTAQAGDCGYPVCDSILGAQVHSSNLSYIAQVCNDTAGCEGFNSNGRLKRCLPPRCAAGQSGMEPDAPCNLYTKIGQPKPTPQPQPPPQCKAAPSPLPDAPQPFHVLPGATIGGGVTPLCSSNSSNALVLAALCGQYSDCGGFTVGSGGGEAGDLAPHNCRGSVL